MIVAIILRRLFLYGFTSVRKVAVAYYVKANECSSRPRTESFVIVVDAVIEDCGQISEMVDFGGKQVSGGGKCPVTYDRTSPTSVELRYGRTRRSVDVANGLRATLL